MGAGVDGEPNNPPLCLEVDGLLVIERGAQRGVDASPGSDVDCRSREPLQVAASGVSSVSPGIVRAALTAGEARTDLAPDLAR